MFPAEIKAKLTCFNPTPRAVDAVEKFYAGIGNTEKRRKIANYGFSRNETPLLICDSPAIAAVLLDAGADPTMCTYDDRFTPLYVATLADDIQVYP